LKADEDYFKHVYIPRTLEGVIDIERDIKKLSIGEVEEVGDSVLNTCWNAGL
jgi:hypothetical protein